MFRRVRPGPGRPDVPCCDGGGEWRGEAGGERNAELAARGAAAAAAAASASAIRSRTVRHWQPSAVGAVGSSVPRGGGGRWAVGGGSGGHRGPKQAPGGRANGTPSSGIVPVPKVLVVLRFPCERSVCRHWHWYWHWRQRTSTGNLHSGHSAVVPSWGLTLAS